MVIQSTPDNSNPPLTQPKSISPGFPLYIHCNFTLRNSNPTVTWTPANSNQFSFPLRSFSIWLHPRQLESCFEPLKSRGKSRLLASKHRILDFDPIDVLKEYSLLVEATVDGQRVMWSSFTPPNSKMHALFRLCFVTLHSDL